MPVDQLTYVDTQPDLSKTKIEAFRDKLRSLDFPDSKKIKFRTNFPVKFRATAKFSFSEQKFRRQLLPTRKFCFSAFSFVHVGRISSLEKRVLKFSEQIYPCAFNL